MRIRNHLLLLFACAVFLSGCGGSGDAVVQGKATHEKKPVAAAEVVFENQEDANEQFFGVTGEDGTLHLTYREREGMPPGRYTIRITHLTQRDGTPLPEGEEGAVLRQSGAAVARAYVLEKDVAEGVNELDLKLEEAKLEENVGHSLRE